MRRIATRERRRRAPARSRPRRAPGPMASGSPGRVGGVGAAGRHERLGEFVGAHHRAARVEQRHDLVAYLSQGGIVEPPFGVFAQPDRDLWLGLTGGAGHVALRRPAAERHRPEWPPDRAAPASCRVPRLFAPTPRAGGWRRPLRRRARGVCRRPAVRLWARGAYAVARVWARISLRVASGTPLARVNATAHSRAVRRRCARRGVPAPNVARAVSVGQLQRRVEGERGGDRADAGRRTARNVFEDGPPRVGHLVDGVEAVGHVTRERLARRSPPAGRRRSGRNDAGSRVTSAVIAAGLALSPHRGSVPGRHLVEGDRDREPLRRRVEAQPFRRAEKRVEVGRRARAELGRQRSPPSRSRRRTGAVACPSAVGGRRGWPASGLGATRPGRRGSRRCRSRSRP